MATLQEISRDMRKQFGGKQAFINITEICEYTGWGRDKVRKEFADVERLEAGKEKLFFINDVARRLCDFNV